MVNELVFDGLFCAQMIFAQKCMEHREALNKSASSSRVQSSTGTNFLQNAEILSGSSKTWVSVRCDDLLNTLYNFEEISKRYDNSVRKPVSSKFYLLGNCVGTHICLCARVCVCVWPGIILTSPWVRVFHYFINLYSPGHTMSYKI